MPNVKPAVYTVQVGATFTPEVAGEIAAWAELLNMSASEVARECVEAGLTVRRGEWASRLTSRQLQRTADGDWRPARAVLSRRVAEARERGNRQVRRRRAYDERTRNTTPTASGVEEVSFLAATGDA